MQIGGQNKIQTVSNSSSSSSTSARSDIFHTIQKYITRAFDTLTQLIDVIIMWINNSLVKWTTKGEEKKNDNTTLYADHLKYLTNVY